MVITKNNSFLYDDSDDKKHHIGIENHEIEQKANSASIPKGHLGSKTYQEEDTTEEFRKLFKNTAEYLHLNDTDSLPPESLASYNICAEVDPNQYSQGASNLAYDTMGSNQYPPSRSSNQKTWKRFFNFFPKNMSKEKTLSRMNTLKKKMPDKQRVKDISVDAMNSLAGYRNLYLFVPPPNECWKEKFIAQKTRVLRKMLRTEKIMINHVTSPTNETYSLNSIPEMSETDSKSSGEILDEERTFEEQQIMKEFKIRSKTGIDIRHLALLPLREGEKLTVLTMYMEPRFLVKNAHNEFGLVKLSDLLNNEELMTRILKGELPKHLIC